jgi:ribonuclease HI
MTTIDSRAIQVHTDGSCYMQQNRISGCAAWVVYPDHLALPEHQIVDFGCGESSNNRMELMACVKALRWAMENEPWRDVTCVCIVSDSDYLVSGFKSVQFWKKNGWRKTSGEPVANDDLWNGILKCVVNLSKVRLRVSFHWVPGKKTAIGKIVDKAAKAAARRGGWDTDHGYSPGSYARSMVGGGAAAQSFPASGQTEVIRPYMKRLRPGREEKVSFNLFHETTQEYSGKYFAYAEPQLSFELHKGNGFRVRFNSDPKFPQIVQIIEPIQLRRPKRKRKAVEDDQN